MQAGGGRTGLCLSCHDGVVASALRGHSTSTTGQRPHSKASTPAGSHPVGADYLEAFRRNPDDYNDPALSPKIVLEEGLVGCSSCHAAHDLGTVSAFNVREDVCMACHQR